MKQVLFSLSLLFSVLCSYVNATTYRVTPAGAGNKDGSSWANAMDYAAWEAHAEADSNGVAPGDIYYFRPEEDGSGFTLTSHFISAVSGTATAPIKIIGVKKETTNENPVFSDWAFGDDRPSITNGGAVFGSYTANNYWHYYNLRLTGTNQPVLGIASYGIVFNCKAHNIDDSLAKYAFRINTNSKAILCEFISNLSYAVYATTNNTFTKCYIHDSSTGFYLTSSTVNIADCVIANCGKGIDVNTMNNINVRGCTIYGCTTGIDGTTGGYGSYINNIISNCTTGANWTTAAPSNFWAHNCFYNPDGTNRVNVDAGLNDIEADPKLKASADGDFTLQSDSPCLDAGMQLTANQGLPAGAEYKVNIGACQDDMESGTGRGGTTSYGFVQ